MSGSCAKPFAGNPSMNELDDKFMEALFKGEISVDQAVALRLIRAAVRDYLYFGLGRNGITPEKFLYSYWYLFYVRSDDPRTWGNCSLSKRYRDVDNKLNSITSSFRPKEIQYKCFDTHFYTSGLAKSITIQSFLGKISRKRETIINENLPSILLYMDTYRDTEWSKLKPDQQEGKYSFPRVSVVSTLTAPKDGKALARLYLYGAIQRSKGTISEDGSLENKRQTSLFRLKYKKMLWRHNEL